MLRGVTHCSFDIRAEQTNIPVRLNPTICPMAQNFLRFPLLGRLLQNVRAVFFHLTTLRLHKERAYPQIDVVFLSRTPIIQYKYLVEVMSKASCAGGLAACNTTVLIRRRRCIGPRK